MEIRENVDFAICNRAKESWRIVVLQQDIAIGGMFAAVFPRAWMVLPPLPPARYLPGTKGDTGTWNFTYPPSLQICVCEKVNGWLKTRRALHYPAFTRGNTSRQEFLAGDNERITVKNVSKGDRWEFYISNQLPHLERICSGTTGVISCLNRSKKTVDISICKNDLPLLTRFGVKEDEEVEFFLTPKLWVMYSDSLVQGDIINEFIKPPISQEIDLKDISRARLVLKPGPGYGSGGEWELETWKCGIIEAG